MTSRVVFPSFRNQEYSQFEMRQLVSALELRFQSLESDLQQSTIPDTDPVGDTGPFAPLVHTHVVADITDFPTSIFFFDDVTGTPILGDTLIWNGTAFETAPVGAISLALNDLTDVNVPAPSDQEVLTYDQGSGQWIAQTSAAMATSFFDLTDTNLSGQSQYDMVYNSSGTEWQATGGLLQWNPNVSAMQFANSYSINWLDQSASAVEMLVMEGGDTVSSSWGDDADDWTYDSIVHATAELESTGICQLSGTGMDVVHTSDDGLHVVIGTNGDDDIWSFTLDSPYDYGNATSDGAAFSITNPWYHVSWINDGNQIMVQLASANSLNVYNCTSQYVINGSLGAAVQTQSNSSLGFPTSGESSYWMTRDGTRLFGCGEGTTGDDVLRSFVLTTPYDITTFSFVAEQRMDNLANGPTAQFQDFHITPDGLTIVGIQNRRFWIGKMSTPFDITTLFFNSPADKNIQTDSGLSDVAQVQITSDGNTLYGFHDNSASPNITQYNLATPNSPLTVEALYVGDPGYRTSFDGLEFVWGAPTDDNYLIRTVAQTGVTDTFVADETGSVAHEMIWNIQSSNTNDRGYRFRANGIDLVEIDERFNLFSIFGPNTLRLYSSGNVDYVELGHDGTNAFHEHLTTTNHDFLSLSGNVRIRDGAGLQILDASDTDTATFNHDGTDFLTTFAGTDDWRITGLTTQFFLDAPEVVVNASLQQWNNDAGERYFEMDELGPGGSQRMQIDVPIAIQTGVENRPSLYIEEQAAAVDDFADFGQWWVRNDTPNTPMFTDDAGGDWPLARVSGTAADNQIAIWNSPTTIEGDATLTYDGTVFQNDNQTILGDPGLEGTGILLGGVTYDSQLKVSDIGTSFPAQLIMHRHSDANSGIITFGRSRGETDAHVIVQDNDVTGGFIFAGWDGASYQQTSQIRSEVDGTPGAGDMPGRLTFWTTPDGAIVPVERIRMPESGGLRIWDDTVTDYGEFTHDGTDFILTCSGTSDFQVFGVGSIIINSSLKMAEASTNSSPGAGFGEYWVRDDVPSVPMFTNDIGEDFRLDLVSGGGASLSGIWQYDDTTTEADPGDGNFRTDNNTVGSVTEIYLSNESKPGFDATNIINLLAAGDQIYIQNSENSTQFILATIDANVDNGAWNSLEVTLDNSNANFTDGAEFGIALFFGGTGAGGPALPVPTVANSMLRSNGTDNWFEVTNATLNTSGNMTAVDFNGVALTTAGAATNYLDETGNYSVPSAGAATGDAQFQSSWLFDIATTPPIDVNSIAFNNATPSSASGLLIADTDENSVNRESWSEDLLRGHRVRVTEADNANNYNEWIVRSVSNQVGYWQVNGTWLGGSDTLPSDDESLIVEFIYDVHVDSPVNPTDHLAVPYYIATDSGGPQNGIFPHTGLTFSQPPGNATELIWSDEEGEHFRISVNNGTTTLLAQDGGASSVPFLRLHCDEIQIRDTAAAAAAPFTFFNDLADPSFTVGASTVPARITFRERNTSPTAVGAFGNLWVRDDTPNKLIFTDDAGTDFDLSGGVLPVSSAEGEILVGDGSGGWREGFGIQFQASAAPPTADEGYMTLQSTATVDVRRPQIFAESQSTQSVFAFFETAADDGFYQRIVGNGADRIAWGREVTSVDTDMFSIREDGSIRTEAGADFFLAERAAAAADISGYGQVWVNSSDENLYFTNESGTDYQISGLGAGITELTGDVTAGPGSGSQAATIPAGTVTNTQLADMAGQTVKVRTVGTGVPQDLSVPSSRIVGNVAGVVSALDGSQVNTILPNFTSGLDGLAPASGGGTTNFLRADGTWTAPSATITPPIVLLDDEEIQFGTGTDATVDFVSAQNRVEWNLLAGVGFRVADATDTGLYTVSMSVFRLEDDCEFQMTSGANETMDIEWNGTVIEQVYGSAVTGHRWEQLDVLEFRDGGRFEFYDSTDSDIIGISHDGSDLNFTKEGGTTGDVDFQDGLGLRMFASNNTDSLRMWHDGTAFNMDGNLVNGIRIFDPFNIRSGNVLSVYDSTNTDRVLVQHNGTSGFIQCINGDLIFRDTSGSSTLILRDNGNHSLLHGTGGTGITTIDYTTSGNTSSAQITGASGTGHDIGFNDLQKFNDNVSDTLEAGHAGLVAFKDTSTARTLTLAASGDTDFPVDGMTTVINAFTSGNYTVNEGTGTTLYYLDGSTRTDTAGGCTVGPGGVANIWRESTTVYYIWGTGITP